MVCIVDIIVRGNLIAHMTIDGPYLVTFDVCYLIFIEIHKVEIFYVPKSCGAKFGFLWNIKVH